MFAPPAEFQAAFASGAWRSVAFLEVAWPSGTAKFCSLPWDYAGFGGPWLASLDAQGRAFVGLEELEETVRTGAREFRLTFLGATAADVNWARQERAIGALVSVWYGVLGDDGLLLATPAAPKRLWIRRMEIDVSQGVVTCTCSDRSERSTNVAPTYRSRQHVRSLNSASKFGDHIKGIADKELTWPEQGFTPEIVDKLD